MLLNERNEFEEMLIVLFDAYSKSISEMQINTWFSLMEEYSMVDIRAAMQMYMKKEKYPPVPAGVIQYMASKQHDVIAEEAWEHVPKLESQSGYVTARMMKSLGVAEELIAVGDTIGARLSFIRSYNNLPPDDNFYYSEAYGVDYEDKEQHKINDYKLLENKGWMTKESLLMLKPPRLLMIENGSQGTLTESEKSRGKKCVSTILEMLDSSQEDTTQD